MAKIPENAFTDWQDGQVIKAKEYKQEREMIRTAINNNDDNIEDLETRKANKDEVENVQTDHEQRLDGLDQDVTTLNQVKANKDEVEQVQSSQDERLTDLERDTSDLFQEKADKVNTYTKAEVNNALDQKTNLAGNHEGTWRGLVPTDFNGGEQAEEIFTNQVKQVVVEAGTQIIEATRQTPLQVNRIDGDTTVNLIPPFTSREWSLNSDSNVNIVSLSHNKIVIENTSSSHRDYRVDVNIKELQNYVFNSIKDSGEFHIVEFDEDGNNLNTYATLSTPLFFTTSESAVRIRIYLRVLTGEISTFKNLMLTEGTEQHEFVQGVQHTTGVYINSKQYGEDALQGVIWEQGGILVPSGDLVDREERIRSSEFVYNIANGSIYESIVKEGYNLAIHQHEEYGGFLSDTGWLDSNSIISILPETHSIRLLMRKIDDTPILPEEAVLAHPKLLEVKSSTYQYFARDSKGDVLRFGDGEYYENGRKWKEWNVISLDGSEDWSFNRSYSGHKLIQIDGLVGYRPYFSHILKYDGKIVDEGSFDIPDTHTIYSSGRLFLTIPNTDSGWGDDYTPTPAEIQAMLKGWKMSVLGQPSTTLYNGSGTKVWIRLWNGIGTKNSDDISTGEGQTTLPTSMNDMGYNPYQLHYKLAEPYWEEIVTEGQVLLEEGSNHVTLGSGMVVREIVGSLHHHEVEHRLNIRPPHPGENPVEYLPKSFIQLYENSFSVNNYRLIVGASLSYWYGGTGLAISTNHYKPTAQYTVTYLALPHVITAGVKPAQAEIYENINANVLKNTRDIADTTKRVNVLEMQTFPDLSQYAHKKQEEWIEPTLLNGWESDSNNPVTFYKDDLGIVRIEGIVSNGEEGEPVFVLPRGYRPLSFIRFPILRSSSSVIVTQVQVTSGGNVIIHGNNEVNSISSISFRAGQ